MGKKPTIEELEQEAAFTRVLSLSYDDIATFVISSLKKFNLPMMLTWTIMAASIALIIIFWPGIWYTAENPRILWGLAFGFLLIPLMLVPVHELLHLIPYRLAGAKDIRFGADLRQGIIYVTAHRFVAGRKLFATVALIPFITVTAGLIAAMIFSFPWYRWVLSMALFTHTSMCAGDTALLGKLSQYRGRRVYTWDDADRKEAYFYAEKENNHIV